MSAILVIEDDKQINALLCRILEQNGYQTDSAYDGMEGLRRALAGDYPMILMDLMLPLKTGEEVLRELRLQKSTPVIVISAKSDVHDRIELLKLGADDYITKPFDIDEVLLRVKAVLRRTETQDPAVLRFRDIRMELHAGRVFVQDTEILCTAMEYAILKHMLQNPTMIFSKRKLYELISGEYYMNDDNTMNVHISNLRKKIRKVTPETYIETIYGMGYRLVN